ncbi:MAG: hypothetical protein WAM85_20875 [Terracidiphilus sp.]
MAKAVGVGGFFLKAEEPEAPSMRIFLWTRSTSGRGADNLDELLAQLAGAGVRIDSKTTTMGDSPGYGTRVELWQAPAE